MDELALLREQLALERDHRSAVRHAARAALEARYDPEHLQLFAACALDYLLWSGSRGVAQDGSKLRLLKARTPSSVSSDHALLDSHASTLDEPARAVLQLKATGDPVERLRAYLALPESAQVSGRPLPDGALEHYLRIEDWRELAGIDADSILEERERFECLRRALPGGVSLGTGVSGGD